MPKSCSKDKCIEHIQSIKIPLCTIAKGGKDRKILLLPFEMAVKQCCALEIKDGEESNNEALDSHREPESHQSTREKCRFSQAPDGRTWTMLSHKAKRKYRVG